MNETTNTTTASVRQLIGAVKEQMAQLSYKPSSVERMDDVWRNLAVYCEQHTNGVLTDESAQGFVLDVYGGVLGEKRALYHVNRAIHMLQDFQKFGIIFKRSRATLKVFSEAYDSLFESFLEDLRKDGFSEGTIKTWRGQLFRFEHFLVSNGIDSFDQIELHHVNEYIKTLDGFSSGTVRSIIRLLGRLSDYAVTKGWHNNSFSNALPEIYRTHRYRLPIIFTPNEVNRILESVDHDNALGKRNYAVLLLVARLGLRISDARLLRFESIDWQSKRISIIQKKTGVPLELPLPDDVGWAIIDYLKHGRPETNCEHIFVRHVAPYDTLTDNFQETVINAVRKAGVKVPEDKPVGMHAFRHSIATAMLSNGVKLTDISQTLGHTTPESTRIYLGMGAELLRQCALEVVL